MLVELNTLHAFLPERLKLSVNSQKYRKRRKWWGGMQFVICHFHSKSGTNSLSQHLSTRGTTPCLEGLLMETSVCSWGRRGVGSACERNSRQQQSSAGSNLPCAHQAIFTLYLRSQWARGGDGFSSAPAALTQQRVCGTTKEPSVLPHPSSSSRCLKQRTKR